MLLKFSFAYQQLINNVNSKTCQYVDWRYEWVSHFVTFLVKSWSYSIMKKTRMTRTWNSRWHRISSQMQACRTCHYVGPACKELVTFTSNGCSGCIEKDGKVPRKLTYPHWPTTTHKHTCSVAHSVTFVIVHVWMEGRHGSNNTFSTIRLYCSFKITVW